MCSSRVFGIFLFSLQLNNKFLSVRFLLDYRRCRRLDVGGPESLHHLVGGVGACRVTLSADNLASGDHAELGGQVVFGLGGSGVDVFVGLAVTKK